MCLLQLPFPLRTRISGGSPTCGCFTFCSLELHACLHVHVSRDQCATPSARPCQILHRLDGARQFGQFALPTAYASQRLCNIRQFSKPPSHTADITMSKLSLAVKDDNCMERGPSNSAASPSARYWRAALSSAHTWKSSSWLENHGGFFQTFSPRVLPCLSTTAHCRDSSMQLQLTLRKILQVFWRLCCKSCVQVLQCALLLVHQTQHVLYILRLRHAVNSIF